MCGKHNQCFKMRDILIHRTVLLPTSVFLNKYQPNIIKCGWQGICGASAFHRRLHFCSKARQWSKIILLLIQQAILICLYKQHQYHQPIIRPTTMHEPTLSFRLSLGLVIVRNADSLRVEDFTRCPTVFDAGFIAMCSYTFSEKYSYICSIQCTWRRNWSHTFREKNNIRRCI